MSSPHHEIAFDHLIGKGGTLKAPKIIYELVPFYDSRGTYGWFPKIWVPFAGVPIIRIVLFGGPYWGSLLYGNYHIFLRAPIFQTRKRKN